MTYRETLFKYVIYSLLKDSSELYFNWIKLWLGLDNLNDNEFYLLNDYHHEFYIHYVKPPEEDDTPIIKNSDLSSSTDEKTKNGDQFWTHEWQVNNIYIYMLLLLLFIFILINFNFKLLFLLFNNID